MTVAEYDIHRLVWNLVSQGLKPHALRYSHYAAGHGQPAYSSPDLDASCAKWFYNPPDHDGVKAVPPTYEIDNSKECTCGADKHNQLLRDMADELLNLINAKQAVR